MPGPYDAAVDVPRTTEIAVVGAGAIGAAAALQLALAGREVLLLDRGAVGQGASAGTACLITPSHAERLANPEALKEGIRFLTDPAGPLAIRPSLRLLPWLARFTAASVRGGVSHAGTDVLRRASIESVELHRAWSAAYQTGLVEHGVLNVWTTEAGDEHRRRWADEHRAAGIEVQLLDAAEVRELEPLVRGARYGSLYPGDAHVDSLGFTQAAARAAEGAGARVIAGVDVLRLVPGHASVRLDTTAGPVDASQVVIAAGVWSSRLARDAGVLLPMWPAKGYHVEYAGVPAPQRPIFLGESRVVATPLEGRVRLAGTLEFGSDPDAVDYRRVDAITRAGADRLDGLAGATPSAVWRGPRPVTADGMPMVGRAPANDRVIIAAGHAMLGITMAPVTAQWVEQLARGEELAAELHPLAPGRFHRIPRLR
ncbi:MAG: D-amino-acid dehydrogenase [Gaiellaceae bacterium]|nr:D-amino-acid dehydrogenase [Gaiellaceae bacterium]